MSELTVNEQRFRVVELEGYGIGPGSGRKGPKPPGISCSVLDSAWAWKEVARFGTDQHWSRSKVRAAASEIAAELNLSCRSDEAA